MTENPDALDDLEPTEPPAAAMAPVGPERFTKAELADDGERPVPLTADEEPDTGYDTGYDAEFDTGPR